MGDKFSEEDYTVGTQEYNQHTCLSFFLSPAFLDVTSRHTGREEIERLKAMQPGLLCQVVCTRSPSAPRKPPLSCDSVCPRFESSTTDQSPHTELLDMAPTHTGTTSATTTSVISIALRTFTGISRRVL